MPTTSWPRLASATPVIRPTWPVPMTATFMTAGPGRDGAGVDPRISERLDRATQALLDADRGLVAEGVARERHVGVGHAHVAGAARFAHGIGLTPTSSAISWSRRFTLVGSAPPPMLNARP